MNENKYIVIYYNDKDQTSKGGYGDKIVGLVSSLMISKLINYKFKICWERDNFNDYFDIQHLIIKSDNFNENNSKKYDHIDFKNYFIKNKNNIFPYKFNIITIGNEISHFLVKNDNLSIDYFYEHILNYYQNIYKNILIPKKNINDEINKLCINKNNPIVGIQIRMGDSYIKNIKGFDSLFSSHRINSTKNKLKELLKYIKTNIKFKQYSVFITSDFYDNFTISKEIFDDVIYYNSKITHSGQSKNINFIKILVDNIFLANKCDQLFISQHSNFGRIAALANKSDDIYDIFCQKLNKKKLISKYHISFT
jgi:hypothetical protein